MVTQVERMPNHGILPGFAEVSIFLSMNLYSKENPIAFFDRCLITPLAYQSDALGEDHHERLLGGDFDPSSPKVSLTV